MPTDAKISDEAFIQAAKALFEQEGKLEIDADAKVSRNEGGDDGAYVQAWVWVENEDATHCFAEARGEAVPETGAA
jgi:hypothetical protein